jgi:hypothetical protein
MSGFLSGALPVERRFELRQSTLRRQGFQADCPSGGYFPMQNVLKMESSRSSVVVRPTISPTALVPIRKSTATKSSGVPARN